ncbi:poly [ADP-ribose] polymerase tankyrase-like [Neocloeon triangulifer]|uniref:poly [ADP-ribose] polymerase tankyrase-like n=1 Tax=Neocloeon triangulifer TaxID=2078957 RepID=UPI00286F9D49|nr:poly [ADP-ribose] polymerase tankyrase-like [Neocloeon triangulifer]
MSLVCAPLSSLLCISGKTPKARKKVARKNTLTECKGRRKSRKAAMAELMQLEEDDQMYADVAGKLRATIKPHKNGIPLSDYTINKISLVINEDLQKRHADLKELILIEMNSEEAEEMDLYHGSPNALQIVNEGFSVQLSAASNMFGKGIYFASYSSKSNQYAWGNNNGCPAHRKRSCTKCVRHLLVCRCFMGNIYRPKEPVLTIPKGYHSVVAEPGVVPTLRYPEYAVLNGDQALPLYLIEYTIVP